MTDAARVIGATSEDGNRERFARLPPALHDEMRAIYQAPYVVVGQRSIGPWAEPGDAHVFVLSRDPGFTAPAPHLEVVRDAQTLIDRFRDSDDELLVAGGATALRLFVPHAASADVALSNERVPGDVVFRDWDGRFLLESEKTWEGGVTRRYVRRGVGLNHAISLYMDGIRDGRPREAIAAHTGDRYVQHSTGVPDGKDGFVAFFEPFLERNPDRDIRVVRALEDDGFCFVHAYQSLNQGAARWVTMDFFRFDDDERIVEHWDVIAEYRAANPSGRSSVDGATEVVDLERTEQNRAVVRELIEGALFADGDPAVVDRLVAEPYLQHNPDLGDGRDALRALVAGPERPLVYEEIVRCVAQGNFVATLCKTRLSGEPYAHTDLFRLEDGKIVEHWDAAEPALPSEVNGGKF